jgi:hypothetical protein
MGELSGSYRERITALCRSAHRSVRPGDIDMSIRSMSSLARLSLETRDCSGDRSTECSTDHSRERMCTVATRAHLKGLLMERASDAVVTAWQERASAQLAHMGRHSCRGPGRPAPLLGRPLGLGFARFYRHSVANLVNLDRQDIVLT